MDAKHVMSWDTRYMFPLTWSREGGEAQVNGSTVDRARDPG